MPLAMVLAAGLGTRLRPLTDLRAKPLVPVGDRPALAHVLERLRQGGLDRVVVNAHHHLDQLRAFAAAEPGLALSEEVELLGTAGGVARARALLGEGELVLWNADILADLDVAALLAAHGDAVARGDEGTLVVQPLPAGQGPVGVDGAGRIVRLRQARFGEEASGGQFLGIQVLGAELRARTPQRGGLIEDLYVPALARGQTLRAFPFTGPWYDVGSLESYLAANVAWLDARGVRSWVASSARVAPGVLLEGSLVGEGAVVTGRGALRRCVVWPGARAEAPLEGRVVTS